MLELVGENVLSLHFNHFARPDTLFNGTECMYSLCVKYHEHIPYKGAPSRI